MNRHWLRIPLFALLSLGLKAQAAQSLDLKTLLTHIHERHPDLLACQAEIRQHDSRLAEAGLLDNPRLETMAEDLLGTAGASSQNYQQWTLSVSQTLPLGARLRLLQESLQLQRQVLISGCQIRQRQLDQTFAQRYLEVLLHEQNQARLQQLQALASDLLTRTETLISRGKLTALERTLPAAEVERLALEQTQLELQLQHSRARLLSYVTIPPETPLSALPPLPVLPTDSQTVLEQHPRYRQQQHLLAQARAESNWQLSRATPDLTLSSGARWHPQSQEWGINLSAGIPLQVFNSNQHGIAATQALIQQRQLELEQLTAELRREWQQLAAQLRQARARAEGYSQRILPLLHRHLEKLKTGLEAGKYTVLQLIQAQQQLQRSEQEALSARQEVLRLENELRLWLE
jgi:cobalt-zinc-cadmium efflux system outer membrane protein